MYAHTDIAFCVAVTLVRFSQAEHSHYCEKSLGVEDSFVTFHECQAQVVFEQTGCSLNIEVFSGLVGGFTRLLQVERCEGVGVWMGFCMCG